jgi:hypothetical protein
MREYPGSFVVSEGSSAEDHYAKEPAADHDEEQEPTSMEVGACAVEETTLEDELRVWKISRSKPKTTRSASEDTTYTPLHGVGQRYTEQTFRACQLKVGGMWLVERLLLILR